MLRALVPVPLLLGWLLVGCVAVPSPKPYEDFAASLTELEKASEQVAAEVQKYAEQSFLSASPLAEDVALEQVILTWSEDDDTRGSAEAKPLHEQFREMRRGMSRLNTALASYSGLLRGLAGGAVADAERISAIGKDANQHLRAARDQLKADVPDNAVASFATIATEVLRQRIESQRKEFLKETQRAAQPTIEAFSKHLVLAMSVLVADVKLTYSTWVDEQRRAYKELAPKQIAERRQIVFAVIEHNGKILLLLDALRTLRAGYVRLPAVHQALVNGIDQPSNLAEEMTRLAAEVTRLQSLYKDLASSDS